MAFRNQPGCGCCTPPGQYCLTSALFYRCADVISLGFTVTFYDNWISGTTVPATYEHQEVVASLPYCYTPANPSHGYGILFQRSGWIDVIVRPGEVNSSTVNYSVGLAPNSLSLTHDFGSGLLTTTQASPFIQSGLLLAPLYGGCFAGTADDVICQGSAQPCGPPTPGNIAFALRMQVGNTSNKATMVQTTPVLGCTSGGFATTLKFLESACGGGGVAGGFFPENQLSSSCPVVAVSQERSPTIITSCNPVAFTFDFPPGDASYTNPNDLFGTASATVTL